MFSSCENRVQIAGMFVYTGYFSIAECLYTEDCKLLVRLQNANSKL